MGGHQCHVGWGESLAQSMIGVGVIGGEQEMGAFRRIPVRYRVGDSGPRVEVKMACVVEAVPRGLRRGSPENLTADTPERLGCLGGGNGRPPRPPPLRSRPSTTERSNETVERRGHAGAVLQAERWLVGTSRAQRRDQPRNASPACAGHGPRG